MVDGNRMASRCSCIHLDRRVALFNRACIPVRFANKWIEYYEEGHRSQRQIKYSLLAHKESYEPGQKGFLLWGEPGIGKTHLLCGLIGYLTLERGIPCRFIEFMRLIMDLKAAYAEGRWDSEVITPLLNVDVLVIDELGKGRNSDFELDILDQLISSRYNTHRTLHCTSNYPPQPRQQKTTAAGSVAMALREEQVLAERVGERIFSRLHDMCQFVHIQGKDYRKEQLKPRKTGRS